MPVSVCPMAVVAAPFEKVWAVRRVVGHARTDDHAAGADSARPGDEADRLR
jgi:hypothetical protein